MPALKNAKHELFAQALAKGETADAAYVQAGFKANRGNATRLKANDSICERIEDILGRAAKTHRANALWLMEFAKARAMFGGK